MMKIKFMFLILLALASLSANVFAVNNTAASLTGVQGYDLVSYHTSKRPIRGNGHFIGNYNDVTYLFANQKNLTEFNKNPQKYIPAYGGYCAFGASVGKKFVGDPEVWRLVNDKLYLNLDTRIQEQWLKDVDGRIKSANKNWRSIKNKAPSEL